MSKFKPGDKVRCTVGKFAFIRYGETVIVDRLGSLPGWFYLQTCNGTFDYEEDCFDLVVEIPKLYFTNFSRDLITYEEAVTLLSENVGGTIYKKVAEVKVETKKSVSVTKLE